LTSYSNGHPVSGGALGGFTAGGVVDYILQETYVTMRPLREIFVARGTKIANLVDSRFIQAPNPERGALLRREMLDGKCEKPSKWWTQ